METKITDKEALTAAALIKEYAAAQEGCNGCVFSLPGSARCIVSHSGCACAWKIPSMVEDDTFKSGDVCIYSFGDKNRSRAVVEIVRILDNHRGVAEIKFLEVMVDDTGNGYFEYLQRTGNTMNASFQYLQKREAEV